MGESEMETAVQKYTQTFSGLELLLGERALGVIVKTVLPAETQDEGKPFAGVQVLLGEPFETERGDPRAWVRFEATDGHRFHRLELLLTLRPGPGQPGYYSTTGVAIVGAREVADRQDKMGRYAMAPLVLRRRLSAPWPTHPEKVWPTNPVIKLREAPSCVVFAADYLQQAALAAQQMGASVVVQWPPAETEPVRFDVARDEARFTAWVMPRKPIDGEREWRSQGPVYFKEPSPGPSP